MIRKMPMLRKTCLLATLLLSISALNAATILLSNGDLEGTVGGGAPTGDNPANWTVTEYNNGMYITGAPGFGNVLHFKEGRGSATTLFLLQDLSANNSGLTAETYSSYTLTLDLGWRTNTAGTDAILRFSLVNLSEGNAELGFTDFTLVKGATVNNSYSLRNDDQAINIVYDNTAGNLVGDSIGLKIARIDVADSGGNDNASVPWVDNLGVAAVPEPSVALLGGLGLLGLLRRRRS